MSEETVKYAYRLCPCDPCDVEGIQSWMEDLAAEGLFLAKDGVFCGVFSFERGTPRKTVYRLDVAQKHKPRFLDSGDDLMEEELELYLSMGWEYLLRYGDFRVYRSTERDAPELNTESETHAITIGLLKKKHRSSSISAILAALFWLLFSHSVLSYGCRIAATMGPVFLLGIYSMLLYTVVTPLLRASRFRQYEKRLLDGDNLNHRVEWRQKAPLTYCVKALPLLLFCTIAVSMISGLSRAGSEIPHEAYAGEIPFATVADVFSAGTIHEASDFMDYGTVKAWSTILADNYEWNESCYVESADGERYYCILRLEYSKTVSEWLARALERDHYVYDSSRYHGKRFKNLTPPELDVDSVRVYNSYGSLHVLMREGNQVVNAVVIIDNNRDQNQWHLWAQAMAEKMKS